MHKRISKKNIRHKYSLKTSKSTFLSSDTHFPYICSYKYALKQITLQLSHETIAIHIFKHNTRENFSNLQNFSPTIVDLAISNKIGPVAKSLLQFISNKQLERFVQVTFYYMSVRVHQR